MTKKENYSIITIRERVGNYLPRLPYSFLFMKTIKAKLQYTPSMNRWNIPVHHIHDLENKILHVIKNGKIYSKVFAYTILEDSNNYNWPEYMLKLLLPKQLEFNFDD